MNTYTPLLRPAGIGTFPPGVTWRYVEAPTMFGLYNRHDIPSSNYRYGVVELSRKLTADERDRFDIRAV